MEKLRYTGGMAAETSAMNARTSAYDTGARLFGGAISDWGNTRTKVLAQQWQNQILREEAQKQNNAALITGLTTLAGGAIGLVVGGPGGAMVGASLGGAAGGAIAGGTGNSAGAGASGFGDIWSKSYDTFSSLVSSDYRNPRLNGGVTTYNTRNDLMMNTNQDWRNLAQSVPRGSQYTQPMSYTNWGGWIPRAAPASGPTLTTRS
jgi:hypothetical protein